MDWFVDAWTRFTSSDELIAVVLAFVLPAILAIINRWVARPKLRYSLVQSLVLLPRRPDGTPGIWRIQRIRVSNIGGQAAEDVEIIFNWQPPHIEQFPHLAKNDTITADGRYVVNVPRLNAREQMTITISSDGPELPPVIYVRGKNLTARTQEFRELVWLSLPGRIFVLTTMALGFVTSIYVVVILLGWVFFGRTPSWW